MRVCNSLVEVTLYALPEDVRSKPGEIFTAVLRSNPNVTSVKAGFDGDVRAWCVVPHGELLDLAKLEDDMQRALNVVSAGRPGVGKAL